MRYITSQFSCEIGNVSVPPSPLHSTPSLLLSLSLTFFFCLFFFLHIDQRGTVLVDDDCHTLPIDRLQCRRVRALGTTSVGQPCSSPCADSDILSIQAVT